MRTTNLFIVRGYVGKPPKTFGKTTKVSIGTNRSYTDSKGKEHDETDWVTVTILNERTAKWVAENGRMRSDDEHVAQGPEDGPDDAGDAAQADKMAAVNLRHGAPFLRPGTASACIRDALPNNKSGARPICRSPGRCRPSLTENYKCS